MALRNLSLRTKLVLALLTVGVAAVAITGAEGYRRAREALLADAVNELTAVREERRRTVEAHFSRLRLETTTLAETRLVGEAMRRFAGAWDDLERQVRAAPAALIAAWRARIAAYHRAHLASHLPDAVADPALSEASMVPADPAALVLQMLYLVADPSNPGAGDDADRRLAAPYAGPYEQAHGTLDHPLKRLVKRHGYSDLYLIDHRTGRIVFTVEREGDLGVSLLTSPHRETNLGRAFATARVAADSSAVTFVDFERYGPSRGEPNAFTAAPIFAGGGMIGVLALEIPIGPVNDIMTGGRSWQTGGLGRTGETFLVGADHRMRSDARPLLEDPRAYLELLTRRGVPERERRLVELHTSTIMLEPLNSQAVEAALSGTTGSAIGPDYRGVGVISAYAPVRIPGVRWGIVAKLDTAEALAPAVALRNAVVATGILIALGVGVLALVLGTRLTRPLARLVDGMQRLGKGNLSQRVAVDRGDEVGQIGAAFNQMAEDLQETTVSRDYVNNILDSMTDAVIVVRPPPGAAPDDWLDAVVTTANPSACALIGRPQAGIVGQRIGDLIPEISAPGEASRRAAFWLEEVVRHGSIGGREVVYRIVDGREVPVLFSSALMRERGTSAGGVVWAAQDLTELKQLQARNAFIRDTFGRYVSDDVVAALLSAPDALRLGGEIRTVTIMMTDLRGFTVLAERLGPEEVVSYLNAYFERVVELILRHRGTINEIQGDGILVIFGAPTSGADDAERAVACAVEMQIAMERFGAERRQQGLITAEMGIGLYTGPVVVGNIGSSRRTKYTAVGNAVNLAARVESYTTGGQILISEETYRAVRAPLVVNGRLRVEPKGAREPITVYDIGGIGPPYDLAIGATDDPPVTLGAPLPIRYAVLEEKHVGRTLFSGHIVRLSRREAEIVGEERVDPLCNLKIWMLDPGGALRPDDIYAKALDGAVSPGAFRVRFTSITPELPAAEGHAI